MADEGLDVEQLLAETWSREVAERVADRVEETPGRGHLVRGVQPGVLEELAPGDVLYEEVVDALAAETGVNVDHATRDTSLEVTEEVLEVLAQRWRDGGRLAVVADEYEEEARKLLEGLTARAAELAGCVIDEGEPWQPLVIEGRLLIDTEGLTYYLARYASHGIEAAERAAIYRLGEFIQAS